MESATWLLTSELSRPDAVEELGEAAVNFMEAWIEAEVGD
jgi:hypothetical protein